MSSTPHKLPEDIWIEIVKYITARQEARNLSQTCRVARDATLPLLFREISFDASRHPKSYWQSYLNQAARRAESLLDNPHLLFHVLEVQLSLRKSTRGTLWRKTSDKISTTISASPRIQKLSLDSCIVTPALHQIIYTKPSLRSLEICYTESSPLLRPQPVVGLTRVSYRYIMDVSPSWFIQLLDCCVTTLTSLTVDDEEVINHLLSISGRQPLALQTLAVRSFPGNRETDVRNLFIMCPELRTLRMSEPFDFVCLDQALTKLEFLEGDEDTLCRLLPGRSIHTVHLTDLKISHPHAPLLQSGKVPVRHLTLVKFSSFLHDELQRLANGFRGLLSFSLLLPPYCREFGTLAAILDAVTDFLSRWPQLQVYRIYSRVHFAPDLSRKYSQFPIAPSGDPSNRGHPSLMEFRFLSNSAWLWFPGEGWTLREVDGTQYPYILEYGPYCVSRHSFRPEPFHSRLARVLHHLMVIVELLDTPLFSAITICRYVC